MRFYWRSLLATHGPSIGWRQQQPFRSTSKALEAYWHMCNASTVHIHAHTNTPSHASMVIGFYVVFYAFAVFLFTVSSRSRLWIRSTFFHLPRRTGPNDETKRGRLSRPLLRFSGVWVSGLVRAWLFGVGDYPAATNRSHSWTFTLR